MGKVSSAAVAAAFLCTFGTVPAPAEAGVQVFGSTLARSCSRAAFAGSASRSAVETCSRALELEALHVENTAGTYVNRGAVLMHRREYDLALADLNRAAELRPNLGEAYVNRGAVHIAQGRPAEGVADIERGLSLGVKQPEKAYFNRALGREQLADLTGAYKDFRKAAELRPDWGLPRREMARFVVERR